MSNDCFDDLLNVINLYYLPFAIAGTIILSTNAYNITACQFVWWCILIHVVIKWIQFIQQSCKLSKNELTLKFLTIMSSLSISIWGSIIISKCDTTCIEEYKSLFIYFFIIYIIEVLFLSY